MKKTKTGTIKIILLFLLAICCMACFAACSLANKYGKEETYYDLNSGNTVYFDGNGNCNFCGADCTYEIKNGNYYIYGDNTLNFKKVKDGVLVDTFKESSSFLNVSIRSGYISGSIMIDNSITNLYNDGSYRIISNNSIVAIGNYYYNDGVLVLEQTGGMTNGGFWVDGIAYSVVYVNEETGKLSGVLLANPSYYKQWHFNGSNENNNNSYLRHTLTYDLNYDGLSITAQPIAKGENINLIAPEREGYKFIGWYYNYSKIESGIWQYDENVTLAARWEAVNYSITYNTDSGIMPEYYLKSFSVSSYELPYTLPIPIKQGLNFVGWYENADFSGEQITTIPKNSLRNYVLYAQYTDEQLVELELSFDETYYSVIGYKGKPQYITIPKTYNSLPVKEIAAKAFEYCDTLISVILSDSITNIGNSAFYDCDSLTSVTIPNSVTSIGSRAFSYCSSLTSITIPGSVTYIDDYMFNGSGLTSVIIPDSVIGIGGGAFESCNLKNVIIPDSVTSIGGSAFSYCSNLTSVTIPDSVTFIDTYAFGYCNSITSIIIPDSVTFVGKNAFPNSLCKRYSGCYYLPTKSSDYGFLYTTISSDDIVSVKVHIDCKTINSHAFRDCYNLTSITIPDGVTYIGNMAFYYCHSLTSVIIPNSVTSIGIDIFFDCDINRLNVFYKGTAESWSKLIIKSSFDTNVDPYYYIATEPTSDGNYWHYDADGKTPIIWQKEN